MKELQTMSNDICNFTNGESTVYKDKESKLYVCVMNTEKLTTKDRCSEFYGQFEDWIKTYLGSPPAHGNRVDYYFKNTQDGLTQITCAYKYKDISSMANRQGQVQVKNQNSSLGQNDTSDECRTLKRSHYYPSWSDNFKTLIKALKNAVPSQNTFAILFTQLAKESGFGKSINSQKKLNFGGIKNDNNLGFNTYNSVQSFLSEYTNKINGGTTKYPKCIDYTIAQKSFVDALIAYSTCVQYYFAKVSSDGEIKKHINNINRSYLPINFKTQGGYCNTSGDNQGGCSDLYQPETLVSNKYDYIQNITTVPSVLGKYRNYVLGLKLFSSKPCGFRDL